MQLCASDTTQWVPESLLRPYNEHLGCLSRHPLFSLKLLCFSLSLLYHYVLVAQRSRALGDSSVADEARRQFWAARNETDSLKINMLIADASNYLDALQASSEGVSSRGGATSGSWLDIDDPLDKRGRVGTGFPWER